MAGEFSATCKARDANVFGLSCVSSSMKPLHDGDVGVEYPGEYMAVGKWLGWSPDVLVTVKARSDSVELVRSARRGATSFFRRRNEGHFRAPVFLSYVDGKRLPFWWTNLPFMGTRLCVLDNSSIVNQRLP